MQSSPRPHFRQAVLAVSLAVCSTSAILAGTTIELGAGTSISLPNGWRVMEQNVAEAPKIPVHSCVDANATSLLLTACPSDANRRVMISLFRTNYRAFGPPPFAGEMGAEQEAHTTLEWVLSQGFHPTETKINRFTSSKNTQLLTIEVSAKSGSGEDRIFTHTAVSQSFATLRFCASRPSADLGAAQEVASMIQSLVTRGSSAQVPEGRNSNTTPNSLVSSSGSSPLSSSSSASPFPTPEAGEAVSAEASKLVQAYHGALVLVEGRKGMGSGFICMQDGTTCVITNAHVMSGNLGIKLTSLDGNVLTAPAGAVAIDRDLMKLPVTGTKTSFEVMSNLDNVVKIGDPVVVLGNAEGARVVKPIEGTVVGIGPDLLEVDAPFVQGNSGSPMIHRATGKVLGVATYYTEKKISRGGNETVSLEIRRFCYRLDNVKGWEPVNWQSFFSQAAQLEKIEGLSTDFVRMFHDAGTKNGMDPANYSSPALQRSIQNFNDSHNHNRKMSMADNKSLLLRFFSDLRNISRADILMFDSRNAYNYFRREAETQSQFRDGLYEHLTRLIETRQQ